MISEVSKGRRKFTRELKLEAAKLMWRPLKRWQRPLTRSRPRSFKLLYNAQTQPQIKSSPRSVGRALGCVFQRAFLNNKLAEIG